jgi:methylmalonyl-CoA/ethylmalonyl-CoA epimerase
MLLDLTFDHLGVAVPDLDRAVSFYEQFFGYRMLSERFDDPTQRARVCFVGTGRPGDLVIEIVAPLGEDSPVGKMLSKGTAAYHACYSVADIEQALDVARAQGCVLVAPPVPAVAFGGRRIAWFYTPTRQLIELVEQ